MRKRVVKTTPASNGVTFARLVAQIGQTHEMLRQQAVRSVNRALVVRNWLVGHYIVEFEQHGADRAEYGDRLCRTLAEHLVRQDTRGLSFTTLNLCRQFYQAYRRIIQTPSEQSSLARGAHVKGIAQTLSAQLPPVGVPGTTIYQTVSDELAGHLPLTWSHYAFLVQISTLPAIEGLTARPIRWAETGKEAVVCWM